MWWRWALVLLALIASFAPAATEARPLIKLKGRVTDVEVESAGRKNGRPCSRMTVKYYFYADIKWSPDEPIADAWHMTEWCFDGHRAYRKDGKNYFWFDPLGPVDDWVVDFEAPQDQRQQTYYTYHGRTYGGLKGLSEVKLYYGPGVALKRTFFLRNFMHYDGTQTPGRDLAAASIDDPEPPIEEGPEEFVGALPDDGTFSRTPDGSVYRTVGGSPVHLYTCAPQGYYPGCPSTFLQVTAAQVETQRRFYPRPVDGALIREPSGAVYRMECGQPRYANSCAAIGGCQGLVDLDGLAVARLTTGIACDDANFCTSDSCVGGSECRHALHPRCAAPILNMVVSDDEACGNGLIEQGEECDDGNPQNGDGCSAVCRPEQCSTCDGQGPTSCVPTTVCRAGDGCCPDGCGAEDGDCARPIEGRRLTLIDRGEPQAATMRLEVRDPTIGAATMNPARDGITLQVFNPHTGQATCMRLAAGEGRWRVRGSGTRASFTYADPTNLNGPCTGVHIRPGKITAKCGSSAAPIGYRLTEPAQGAVAIGIRSGSASMCTTFGGDIRVDSRADRFDAKNAAPPVSCEEPPRRCD